MISRGHVRLSAAEVLAFTVGLAILVTALSALAVSLLEIGITRFVVVFIGLPISFVAYLMYRPAPARAWRVLVAFLRNWFDLSDYSRGEKGVAAVLLAATAVALGVFVGLAVVQYPDTTSMALAITGPGGSADVPRNFTRGIAQAVEVYVLANATPGSAPFTLRIRLVPLNATGNESFHAIPASATLHFDAFAEFRESGITVASQGSARRPYSIALDLAGTFRLRFELLTSADRVLATNFLSVVVA